MTGRVLLLSGGIDSACLAAWLRPEACLYVDYGQRAHIEEEGASRAVADGIGLAWHAVRVDATPVGGGLMLDGARLESAPTAEWWPFRNQLLVTVASAWAVLRGMGEVMVGAVAGDGERHRDGSAWFFDRIDDLVAGQEGGIRVRAPGIEFTSSALIEKSGIKRGTLGVTHSCHAGGLTCAECPGCIKRTAVFASLPVR